jgi:hypothetical protein
MPYVFQRAVCPYTTRDDNVDSALTENGSTHFETDSVHVGRSAVRNINAASVRVEQSAVQRLSAGTADFENSAVGIVNGSTVEVEESAVGIVAGDYVKVEDSRVAILLAPRVSGNVKAFVTLPAAFAFGAGYFFARALAGALFGRDR